MKFQSRDPVPFLSLLIIESDTRQNLNGEENGKEKWEGPGIFSHLFIFKKRFNSSNSMLTSLPHTATKRDASVDNSQLANVSSPRSHKKRIHPFP